MRTYIFPFKQVYVYFNELANKRRWVQLKVKVSNICVVLDSSFNMTKYDALKARLVLSSLLFLICLLCILFAFL